MFKHLLKKIIILSLLVLLSANNSYAQISISYGQMATPFNGTTLTGSAINSGSYTLPSATSGSLTWQVVYGSAPTSITLQLQGSLDNTNWFTLDTITSTTSIASDTSTGANRFVRVRVNTSSGGTTLTVNFVVKEGAGSSGAGGGVGSDVNVNEIGGVGVTSPLPVDCISGCAGSGTEAVDDGSIPGGSTNANNNSFLHAWTSTVWARVLFGQQTMANSISIVIASNQTAIPVTGTFWQATQPVSGTFWQATQPISAAALPLPSGAATSANQTTANTNLNNIETATEAIQAAAEASANEDVIHGAADSNTKPVKIGCRAETSMPTAEVADDRVNIRCDEFGNIGSIQTASNFGGCTAASVISAAAVLETAIKATAGQLYALSVTSIDTTPVYIRVYNDTSAGLDEATDVPVIRLGIPAAPTSDLSGREVKIPETGIEFSTGIIFRVTTGFADNSTGALSANEVMVSYCYK